MKTKLFILGLYCLCIACTEVKTQSWQVIAPENAETPYTAFLLWDKVDGATSYRIEYDGKQTASAHKTYITIDQLRPETAYDFTVTSLNEEGKTIPKKATIRVVTKPIPETIYARNYSIKSGKEYLNTKALQSAIDDCPKGGAVVIPSGTYYTGALFLKSDMTLYLEEGAILQGTDNLNDYPLTPNRFEGWEITTPSALLNGGKIDRGDGFQLRNLSIRGKGMIRGGGKKLTDAMIAHGGERHMGRLICLMNGENITIDGLTIEESPCWTIHYIYCKNVVCKDLVINSEVIRTDGIDPDSSSDCYIYNCTFSNGDDCIAIKSGKNPEGNQINIPTQNVRIVDCNFEKGHGISIGSEMSGGVKNVLIMDCRAGDLLNGLQIKATPQRGGYVEDIRVMDSSIQKIRLFTQLNYNNDGESAEALPIFRNMVFSNLDMTQAPSGQSLIEVNGFDDRQHYTNNIAFNNILLPEQTTIKIKHCSSLTFSQVLSKAKSKPHYEIIESNDILTHP
ncbi:glycosyl hydrolase family 28 protein [Bacteroides sp. 51]|uniref:glycosyl hydrolase family 28 protein n=1 Tax=Bacteroides sp. 51 TaxID=2302938 RepID=UPI0013D02D32|nr:glycoside hydrolase family 28 protein [Bacteroides sp. 51]NDV83240.1 glycoside hydrolase family 28 protein [Bacteroides sp. 51]